MVFIRSLGMLSGVFGEAPSTRSRWNLSSHRAQDDSRRRRTRHRKITDMIIQFIRTSIRASTFLTSTMLRSCIPQVLDISLPSQLVCAAIGFSGWTNGKLSVVS
jgi:hypothetical protein